MLPITYEIESASTQHQVLRRLSSFLDYLRSCHVDSILPRIFSALSAPNADEVRVWAAILCEGGKDTYRLTLAGRCWFEEVRDAFAAAARRLDEIAAERQSEPGVVRRDRSRAGIPVEGR